jgi:diadenosine tetraphosphatase ApaH/serine/threonine PP2A family protein phosphatase
MRTALLADVHSNLEALLACLAHARAQGADRYAFLGDLVGYNADPVRCVQIIAELVESGAPAVVGNHDQAALRGSCEELHSVAREAIYWTREQLGERERAFLESLPLTRREGDVLYAHANARNPQNWEYVVSASHAVQCITATDARIVFLGHVHQGLLYHGAGRESLRAFLPVPGVPIPLLPRRSYVIIVGSVGQPRDGIPAAQYGIHDDGAGTFVSHRVPYDYQTAAAKVLAAGLPTRLALRLEIGR